MVRLCKGGAYETKERKYTMKWNRKGNKRIGGRKKEGLRENDMAIAGNHGEKAKNEGCKKINSSNKQLKIRRRDKRKPSSENGCGRN